jgi:hypothetical protein
MIRIMIIDNTINIACSGDKVIDLRKMKDIYRTALRFIEQHGKIPIVIMFERKLKLNDQANRIFSRWKLINDDLTLVIVEGTFVDESF